MAEAPKDDDAYSYYSYDGKEAPAAAPAMAPFVSAAAPAAGCGASLSLRLSPLPRRRRPRLPPPAARRHRRPRADSRRAGAGARRPDSAAAAKAALRPTGSLAGVGAASLGDHPRRRCRGEAKDLSGSPGRTGASAAALEASRNALQARERARTAASVPKAAELGRRRSTGAAPPVASAVGQARQGRGGAAAGSGGLRGGRPPSPPPYQPPLEAGSLGRSDHLALVPPQLARSAQRPHAAASKAVESLQAQLETLHQLECGAAALRSALGAAPDGTPRDLASEPPAARQGAPRPPLGAPPPTAINAREPEARIRKIVELCAPAPGKTAAAR